MSANDPNIRIDIIPEELWQKILEAANNPLPESTASDKGKYLKANESTGKPEWAEVGGALVVTLAERALNKTWQEIHDAFPNAYVIENGMMHTILTIYEDSGEYGVAVSDNLAIISFTASSASGYPTIAE